MLLHAAVACGREEMKLPTAPPIAEESACTVIAKESACTVTCERSWASQDCQEQLRQLEPDLKCNNNTAPKVKIPPLVVCENPMHDDRGTHCVPRFDIPAPDLRVHRNTDYLVEEVCTWMALEEGVGRH